MSETDPSPELLNFIAEWKKTSNYKAKFKPNKAKWVKALKSRKFKQAQGNLYAKGERYCCLGVYRNQTGCARQKDEYITNVHIPQAIQSYFSGLNDNHGVDFEGIAERVKALL